MIDLSEDLISLIEASKILPGRPHISTLFRLASPRGLRGVRLETLLVGGRRWTSRQALARFVAASTAAGEARRSNIKPAAPAASQDPEVDHALDQAGF